MNSVFSWVSKPDRASVLAVSGVLVGILEVEKQSHDNEGCKERVVGDGRSLKSEGPCGPSKRWSMLGEA